MFLSNRRYGSFAVTLLGAMLTTTSAYAQSITSADSATIIQQTGNQFQIEGGNLSGDSTTLFHSFEQFGLLTGESAQFSNPTIVENIVGRVLGGDASIIDGLLAVDGDANLYLLNPSGIFFGENTQLNLGGSFSASTATGLLFNNEILDVLSTNDYTSLNGAPTGYIFGSEQASAVVNTGDLAVLPGQSLTLLGGQVINTGQLSAPNGEILVKAVPGENLVRLGQTGSLLGLELETLPDTLPTATLTATALPALLTGASNLGLATEIAVNPDGSISLSGSSLQIPTDGATTIVSGQLEADSGNIVLLGEQIALADATVDASGDLGGGTVLIGGERLGNGPVPNALATFIDDGSVVRADARDTGDGGQIVAWGTNLLRSAGQLSARGGANGGDGGFIETSSLGLLDVSATPDVSAVNGVGGLWLLDPANIRIVAGNGLTNIDSTPGSPEMTVVMAGTPMSTPGFGGVVTSPGVGTSVTTPATPSIFSAGTAPSDSILGVDLITNALASGTNVEIITTGDTPGDGNITLETPLDFNNTGTNTLSLTAEGEIQLQEDIFDSDTAQTSPDALNLELLANGNILITSEIRTNGGSVLINSMEGAVTTDRVFTSPNPFVAQNNGTLTILAEQGISTSLLSTRGRDVFLETTQGPLAVNENLTTTSTQAIEPVAGGNVTLRAPNGSITVLPLINTGTTQGNGDGGFVTAEASGPINLGNIFTEPSPAVGDPIPDINNAGDVFIQSGTSISIGDSLNNSIGGFGGDISLIALEDITFRSIDTSSQTGTGGSVTVSSMFGNVRGTGLTLSLPTATIRTEDPFGGGQIFISHGGGNSIPFNVGDASINGTAADIASGTTTANEIIVGDDIRGNVEFRTSAIDILDSTGQVIGTTTLLTAGQIIGGIFTVSEEFILIDPPIDPIIDPVPPPSIPTPGIPAPGPTVGISPIDPTTGILPTTPTGPVPGIPAPGPSPIDPTTGIPTIGLREISIDPITGVVTDITTGEIVGQAADIPNLTDLTAGETIELIAAEIPVGIVDVVESSTAQSLGQVELTQNALTGEVTGPADDTLPFQTPGLRDISIDQATGVATDVITGETVGQAADTSILTNLAAGETIELIAAEIPVGIEVIESSTAQSLGQVELTENALTGDITSPAGDALPFQIPGLRDISIDQTTGVATDVNTGETVGQAADIANLTNLVAGETIELIATELPVGIEVIESSTAQSLGQVELTENALTGDITSPVGDALPFQTPEARDISIDQTTGVAVDVNTGETVGQAADTSILTNLIPGETIELIATELPVGIEVIESSTAQSLGQVELTENALTGDITSPVGDALPFQTPEARNISIDPTTGIAIDVNTGETVGQAADTSILTDLTAGGTIELIATELPVGIEVIESSTAQSLGQVELAENALTGEITNPAGNTLPFQALGARDVTIDPITGVATDINTGETVGQAADTSILTNLIPGETIELIATELPLGINVIESSTAQSLGQVELTENALTGEVTNPAGNTLPFEAGLRDISIDPATGIATDVGTGETVGQAADTSILTDLTAGETIELIAAELPVVLQIVDSLTEQSIGQTTELNANALTGEIIDSTDNLIATITNPTTDIQTDVVIDIATGTAVDATTGETVGQIQNPAGLMTLTPGQELEIALSVEETQPGTGIENGPETVVENGTTSPMLPREAEEVATSCITDCDGANETDETDTPERIEQISTVGITALPAPELALQNFEKQLSTEVTKHLGLDEGKDGNSSSGGSQGTTTAILNGADLPTAQTSLRNAQGQIGQRPALIYAVFGNAARDSDSILQRNAPSDPLELLLVTADGEPKYIQLSATRGEVLDLAHRFRRQVASPSRVDTQTYLPLAQKLYQLLIAPLEAELAAQEIDTISFITDAGLRSLPIAALHDGENFLIENYKVGLMPSLSLTDLTYQEITNVSALVAGTSVFADQLPLPSVPVELDAIASQWNSSLLQGDTFNLDKLQGERQQNSYGIIHLATHGEFNNGDLSKSYLHLHNEKLGLDQLRNIGLHKPAVELITLSACQTALGSRTAELGFAGFAVLAGAKTAVASLWNVSDEASTGLMIEFYQQLQGNQPTIKAEALRQAQLAMLRGNIFVENGELKLPNGSRQLPAELAAEGDTLQDFSHPYYWAAFTVIGSPW